MAFQNKTRVRLLKPDEMTWHYCECGTKVWAPKQIEPGDELTCDRCGRAFRAVYRPAGSYWEPLRSRKAGGGHGCGG